METKLYDDKYKTYREIDNAYSSFKELENEVTTQKNKLNINE